MSEHIEPNYVYVTVRVEIKQDADSQDVVSEMDYDMIHPDIISTEIVSQR